MVPIADEGKINSYNWVYMQMINKGQSCAEIPWASALQAIPACAVWS